MLKISLIFLVFAYGSSEEIETTTLFVIPIKQSLFNWTEPSASGYWFRASVTNAPDLPHWMNYVYSERHRNGFLYGVAPQYSEHIQLELIGVSKDTYEARKKHLFINITEKLDPAKYELRLKVDNLNLTDAFDTHRIERLLKVFTDVLWPSSAGDIHLTFLASALDLGARMPLNPEEGEGVVVHIGSSSEFSDTLINLQAEVKPLEKLSPCPRDFKRTSVERHFRPYFLIDWCSFKLIKLEEKVTEKAQYHESSMSSAPETWQDELIAKESLPNREYSKEILTTIALPSFSMLILCLILSFILCFHHNQIKKGDDDSTIMQYEAVQRATSSLRSNLKSEECSSPKLKCEKDGVRPSPPPYNATKRLKAGNAEDEPKTWYC